MAPRQAKAPGKAVTRWDEEFARMAAATAAAEEAVGGPGKFFSVRGGNLTYQGAAIPNNMIDVVVVDYVFENQFYNTDFDPDNPATPACFAFATPADGDKNMAPHENSADPQHETCAGCPNNEFGSAERGKGKACKNVRRLALLPADVLEDPDEIEKAELAFMKIPVTSVKNWAGYVRQLANVQKKPPVAVVTRIKVASDAKTQVVVNFERVSDVPAQTIGALMAKLEQARNDLVVPYTPMEQQEEAPAPQRGRRGAAPAKGTGKGGAKAQAAPQRAGRGGKAKY